MAPQTVITYVFSEEFQSKCNDKNASTFSFRVQCGNRENADILCFAQSETMRVHKAPLTFSVGNTCGDTKPRPEIVDERPDPSLPHESTESVQSVKCQHRDSEYDHTVQPINAVKERDIGQMVRFQKGFIELLLGSFAAFPGIRV